MRFGVPGQADLTDILPDGRRLEVEAKSPAGRQTQDQRHFQRLIEHFGGLYVLGTDSYAARVEALVSACVEFFRGIGLERAVVLCPGDDRRLFSLMYGWGASTVHTTIRLFKGEDRDVPMAPDRAFIHTPFASEKG